MTTTTMCQKALIPTLALMCAILATGLGNYSQSASAYKEFNAYHAKSYQNSGTTNAQIVHCASTATANGGNSNGGNGGNSNGGNGGSSNGGNGGNGGPGGTGGASGGNGGDGGSGGDSVGGSGGSSAGGSSHGGSATASSALECSIT